MASKGTTTSRALLSLVMIFGMHVLAAAVLVALVVLNYLIAVYGHHLYGGLIVLTVVVAVGILKSGWAMIRRVDHGDPVGIVADPAVETKLFAMIHEIADEMKVRPPDRVIFVPEVNAAVYETGGLFQLKPRHRTMLIGVPLLRAFRIDELKSVLAHELGHYANDDTKLGPLTHRSYVSMITMLQAVRGRTVSGIFNWYCSLCQRVSFKVRRNQELLADQWSMRIAGPAACASSLEKVNVLGPVYNFYLNAYVADLLRNDARPVNAFDGFVRVVAAKGRSQMLLDARKAALEDQVAPFDSHPSLSDRLAAAKAFTGEAGAPEPLLAKSVVADIVQLEQALTALWSKEVLRGNEPGKTLEWDEVAAEIYEPLHRRLAWEFATAIGNVDGKGGTVSLGRLVQLLDDDKAVAMTETMMGPILDIPEDKREEFARGYCAPYLGAYLVCAIIGHGGSMRLNWGGAIELLDKSGELLDFSGLSEAAFENDGEGSGLELWCTPFIAAGVHGDWAPARPADAASDTQTAPATPVVDEASAQILDGPYYSTDQPSPQVELAPHRDIRIGIVPNAQSGRHTYDIMTTSEAIVIIKSKSVLSGSERWTLAFATAGFGSPARVHTTRARRILDLPIEEIAKLKDVVFLPFDAVQSAELKGAEAHWRLKLVTAGKTYKFKPEQQCSFPRELVENSLRPVLGDKLKES